MSLLIFFKCLWLSGRIIRLASEVSRVRILLMQLVATVRLPPELSQAPQCPQPLVTPTPQYNTTITLHKLSQ